MPTLGLFVADTVFLVSLVFLAMAGFRISIRWGIVLLLAPFGGVFFCVRHWQEGGKLYLLKAGSCLVLVCLLVNNPSLFKQYGQFIPFGSRLAGAVAKAEKENSPPSTEAADPRSDATPPPAVRPTITPVDPFAAQRAAVAKHAADLNTQYAELNKARAKLKKGSPQVAAFNAKAAKYQEGLRALAAEQVQLAALDHPAADATASAQAAPAPTDKEAEANAALARLRAMAAKGDYAAFADTLKKCLADYRQTAVFPQIAAAARGTLANATPDRLAAAIQAQGTAARAEMDAAMGRVRGIVNQTPPTVPRPPPDAESYHYGFHPGALMPDFAHADLYSTRELWKGDYVNMDTAPGIFYRSADCEFNPQTKFFYTNRDVPKKKLTDAEIAEVVRLYRAIAADQLVLAALPQRLHDAQGASADLLALNKQLAASR